MIIRRTILENVCQHRYLEHEWAPGLNGIIGPNGSGKSNILKMIKGALTGKFSENPGKQDENISLFAAPGDRSCILVEFEHNGRKAALTWGFRRVTSNLIVDGVERARGNDNVSTAMAALLGVDSQVVAEYVFVQQGCLAAFIDETKTERARMFSRLFGTSEIGGIHDALGRELVDSAVSSTVVDVDALARDLAAREHRVRAVEARIEELDKPSDISEDLDVVRVADGYGSTLDLARVALNKWKADRDAHRSAVVDLIAIKEEFDTFVSAADAMESDVADAKSALIAESARATTEANRKALTQRLAAAEAKLAALRPPVDVPPFTQSDVDDEAATVHALTVAEQLSKTFDPKSGLAECPTCGEPAAAIASRVESARSSIPVLRERKADLVRRRKAVESFIAEYNTYSISLKTAESQRRESSEDLSRLGPESPSSVDVEGLRAIIAEQLRYRDQADKASRRLDKARFQIQLLRQARASSGNRLKLAAERARQSATFLPLADQSRLVCESAKLTSLRIARLRGFVRGASQSVASARADLAAKREEHNRLTAGREWLEFVSECRAVSHSSAWPRAIADRHLAAIADDVNAMLHSFELGFTVRVDADLTFVACFDSGIEQRASRLSGGQRVLLALAFRIAVNSRFAGHLGLLALDEPTMFLDERNIGCLETAIARLQSMSTTLGLQCLLVTHERRLAPSFNAILDLGRSG